MRRMIGLTTVLVCAIAVASALGVQKAGAAARGTTLPCVTPPSGMVAWYPFDETSGTTAQEIAFGNNGTEFGSPLPSHIAGKIGGALNFNGVNDYVESPDKPQINFGAPGTKGDFSIDAWIRLTPNLTNSVTTIVDKRDPNTTFGYSFYLSFKRLGIQLSGPSTPGANYASPAIPTIANGLWHHVAVTVTPGGNAIFYYGGVQQGPAVATAVPGSMVNTSPLRIGTRTAASPFTAWYGTAGGGDMDELEIFNRVLTPAEVSTLANAFPPKSSGKCKNVIKATGKRIQALEGTPVTAAVASFTDAISPGLPASSYSASINWGDATPSSAGTVTGPTGGPFTVTGTHLYGEQGTYTITITITVGSVTATTTGTAIVKDVPIKVSCALPASSSQTFSGPIATFTHNNPAEPNGLNEFVTTVNWGDSPPASNTTPSAFVTVSGASPNYGISGIHTYSTTGPVTVIVTVVDDTESVSADCRIKILPPPPPPCVTPPSGMVAWYPFDETSGTTAAEIAFGNNGTEFGAPLPAHIPGKIAGALNFNGLNDYVESPDKPQINFGATGTPATFSIDAWVRLPSTLTNSVTTILDKRDPNTTFGYSFYISFKRLGIQLSGPSTPGANYASPAIPNLTNGLWHHVAVTVNPGGNALFYFDGVQQGPAVLTANPGSMLNTSPLRIGTRTAASPFTAWYGASGSSTANGSGDMDELEIFNRVLTPAEVLSLATAFPPNSTGKCKHTIKPIPTKFKAVSQTPFTGVVLSFTDTDPVHSPASAYSASIDWGDSTTSAGTVGGPVGGPFTVTGTHTYAATGTYNVTVTITIGSVTATGVSTVFVS